MYKLPSAYSGSQYGLNSGVGSSSPWTTNMNLNYGMPVPGPQPVNVPMPMPSSMPSVSSSATRPSANLMGDVAGATGGADGGNWFQSTFMNEGGGLNLGSIGAVADTIGAFGQLYAGLQANNLAKDSLALQTRAYETNLANQKNSFNLGLEDRITARYAQTGGSAADRDAYISKYKLG